MGGPAKYHLWSDRYPYRSIAPLVRVGNWSRSGPGEPQPRAAPEPLPLKLANDIHRPDAVRSDPPARFFLFVKRGPHDCAQSRILQSPAQRVRVWAVPRLCGRSRPSRQLAPRHLRFGRSAQWLGAHLFYVSLLLEHPPRDFSETFDLYYSTSATKIPLFIGLFSAITAKKSANWQNNLDNSAQNQYIYT